MRHPINNRSPRRPWPTVALFAASGVCWMLLIDNASTRAARFDLATAVIAALLGCTHFIVHKGTRDAASVIAALQQFQSSNETVTEEVLADTVGQFVSTGRVIEIWGARGGRHAAYKGANANGATVVTLPTNGTRRRSS